jgi:saxitoxin biosynthesis operon SxtJ-like protein
VTTRLPTEQSFGYTVGSACCGLAILAWWRGAGTVSAILLVAGVLLVRLAYAAPVVLRRPNRLWWRFAQALGWINSRILLTLFFALVVTPISVAMRAWGRQPLGPTKGATTNWTTYPARRRDPRHYERMF